MNTSIQHLEPKGIVQPSSQSSRTEPALSAWRNPRGPFVWVPSLAGLLFLLFSAPAARADRSPPGCGGSGLGISLYTSLPDVHIGDTISYSVNVFNAPFPACDAGATNPAAAGAIQAFIVTPDGLTNYVTLRRTYLAPGQSDLYSNVVSYVVRAQDIRPDATVRATAVDQGDIHQNDTNSRGGGNQGVNTEVNLPCVQLLAQCVGGVGENGAITFTGTVTNCGNNTLVGVTVTNFHDTGFFTVLFPTNLALGQVAPFSGSWVPLNPCAPSTATLTVLATDQFTSTPRTVTSFTTITCQDTLTPGIKVTKVCPAQPVSPGQLLTFSGSVSNTGNVTLTNIVVVDSQPVANTPVFSRPSLAPGEVASFNGSYTAPTNCSVADTLTATASSRCGVWVSSVASATCPILTTPRIAVAVLCPTTPAVSGGTLTYSGNVRNAGDIPLTNIIVVSDRPALNTTVFTIATLAPGASANFTSSLTVPANACAITTTFSGRGQDLCTANLVTNTVSTTCPITTAPAISVTLACPAAPVATGGLITYSGTVRNSGNVTLNNVTVVNSQAVPSTVLTVPSLAVGASANFTASFTAPADACSVSSTVTASGSDACTQAVVNTGASATCTLVTTPRIALTQNCPANPAGLGGVLTYSGTVSNAGNITLTNVVVTNDRSGTTPVFTLATLAPRASASFTGGYTVPANSGCAITSTLTANAADKCTGTPVSANAAATCPVQGVANIAVTLTCPATATPLGGLLTFSGSVRNAGNVTVTNVVVRRDAPAPNTTVFSVASLAPGVSANFTGSYTVPGNNACSITTSVSASANDQCAGSGVIASASIDCPLVTAPSILVTQACPASPVASGGLIVYGGSVTNTGNITLTNIAVVRSQPAPNTVVFTLGSLAPGAGASFSSSFSAPLDACSAASTLTASGQNQCSGNTVNNSVTTTCPLLTAPQIRVTKACPVTPVTEGGLLVFTGTVTNTGNLTLTNVLVVTDRPAANTRLLGPITLAPGAGTNFTGSYTAPLNACSVTDTLLATGLEKCAGNIASNSISTTCPITTIPRIAVTLACPAAPSVTGGLIAFTGTVRNSGNVTLNNVTVVNSQSVPSTVLAVPNLAPGASANFTASFTAPADSCSVSSTVTASGSDNCSGAVANNSASATCPLLTNPRIIVTQNCPANPISLGGVITYSGSVSNAGNITLTNVVVTNNRSGTTPVFTRAALAPSQAASFTASYTESETCSTTSTLTANGTSLCGIAVTNSASSTCPVITTPAIAVSLSCPVTPIVPGGVVIYTGTVRNSGNIPLTNVTVNRQPILPTSGLVGYWAFNETSGSIAADSSGSGNNGTITNATRAPGQSGNGLAFNGTSAYVDIPNSASLNFTGPLTMAVWIQPRSAVGLQDILAHGYTLSPASGVYLRLWDGRYEAGAWNGTSTVNLVVAMPAGDIGTWVHLAVTFDGSTWTLYRNGVAIGISAGTALLKVDANWAVGARGGGGERFFNGMIDEVQIFNRALSGAEVTTLSASPILFSAASLAAGASGNFTLSGLADTCSATANVLATGQDSCTSVAVTNTASATCPVVTAPAIAVTLACPAVPVATGGLITYTGTVRNSGNITLNNVTVVNSQAVPSTVLTLPSLASGASANFTTSFTAPADACSVSSTVIARGSDNCSSMIVSNSASATCPLVTAPRLVVTQSCPPNPASFGGVLTYSGTVSNPGNITLTNIVVTNDRTGTTPVFTLATLAPGASAGFTGSYPVPANSACSITSTLNGSGYDKCTGSRVTASAAATCPLLTAPRIIVTQTCPVSLVSPGGLLTYSGTVVNAGNITLTNIVVVNNRPAANTVIFTVATLAPGARANFTGSYQVPLNCCVSSSTVGATGRDLCTGATVADTFTATCTVLTVPRIVVTKVCPPTAVRPGDMLQYSGTVSNAGNITLVNVAIVNTQPTAGSPVWGPITLAPGESVSYYSSYLVAPDFCGTDTVTATGLDACTFSPVVSSVTTACPVMTTPRIAVTKNCPAQTTPRGGVFTFTGTVSNPGNVTLTNVVVVNNYQVDCFARTNGPVIGPITLTPGATVGFTSSYTAPQSCCEVVDTLTASGQDRCAGTRVTATATALCPLLSTPRITVTRICPVTPVPVGGLFTYSGSVSNAGDVVLTNVYVLSSKPNANTSVLGPLELAPGEAKLFTGNYTNAANSDPAIDTVTARGTDTCLGRTVTATANCSGPVIALTVTSVTIANGLATVSWTATPGVTYRLQSGSNYQNSAWSSVPGDVTASGPAASKTDAVGTNRQRFYRVMVVQ